MNNRITEQVAGGLLTACTIAIGTLIIQTLKIDAIQTQQIGELIKAVDKLQILIDHEKSPK